MYDLELTRPILLLCLLALPPIAYYFSRSLVDLPRTQRIASLAVRCVIVTLLVLALAGLTLLTPTRELFVVFAIDRSESIGKDAAARFDEYIDQALAHAGGHEVRFLPFAAQPGLMTAERSLESQTLDERGSDLAAALQAASAGIPPQFVPRVVLLSDANETAGAALESALGGGATVDTIPAPARSEPEVQVSSLAVPAQVAQGEPFYIDVLIDSNHDDEVTIEVFRSAHKVGSETKAIKAGENSYRLRQSIDQDRLAEFTARISGGRDTLLDNNSASGLVYATGKPRVLLIESSPELAQHLEWALDEENILVETRPPEGIPDSLADLQNYEVLMLSNVPATSLSAKQMDVVRTYVQDLGGGFIMLGGDQSFGLGGYYKTVIEDVLPVRSDFEKEKEKPSLAMAIVLDKSGSMGGQKIELAKDAAKSAVELLGPKDQIGVVAFDGQPLWVSEIRPMSDKNGMLNRISTIEAGGGTNLAPAMQLAYEGLQASTAKLKHVLILSDGISAPGEFESIAESMSSARITVSTVGIGEGAHQELLERLAEIGDGRYYFTDDPQSIPQIFAKETMTASKSAIHEEPFLPLVMRRSPALADIDLESAPFLLGYVVTRPKPTSEVILATETSDPLLAWWRYGLGMSVAFTSDAKSRWAAEWLTWPGYNKFWAQLVRHAMRKGELKGGTIEIARTGSRATVTYDAVDPLGNFLNGAETELSLIGPDLAATKLAMPQIAPGRYLCEFETSQPGAYHLELAQRQSGQVIASQSRGLEVGYPDELRLRPTNEELLRAISDGTGGLYNPPPEAVFDPRGQTAHRVVPLWPPLTIAAMILFVLDVALRRLDFSLFRRRRVT